MEQFPHLKFIQKIEGTPRFTGGGGTNEQSMANKENRQAHYEKLQRWLTANKDDWDLSFALRAENNLAELSQDIKPIYLQVNPELITTEFNLADFGIEIISEEDDGFIIGASIDNFRTLEAKINGFLNSTRGTAKIADFWQISEGNREVWKPQQILSDELYNIWPEIQNDLIYHLEVSVAFDKPISKVPNPLKRGYEKKMTRYRQQLIDRDNQLMEREQHFENFINHYGTIFSSIVHLDDSFGCEVKITGIGLKDLVINYPYVFEVVEAEKIGGGQISDEPLATQEIDVVAPEENSIEVGVIDSGIMEGNRYLNPAIKSQNSRSYVLDDDSTADNVQRGGHGTKVAGAILFPNGLSNLTSPYQLPFFIRNLRVLNGENVLVHKNPAELIDTIVSENEDCKIFNLSINSFSSFKKKHMSLWASMLDKLTHERKILFIISAGNLNYDTIREHLQNGKDYPDYLHESSSRILNPASSSFGLTVGSINHATYENDDWKSLGSSDQISAYSRIGLGIWGHIKPDVVEYGGGLVISKNGNPTVKEHAETATELVRSTLNGGNAYGRDSVGTSFAAPKVCHIAAKLKQLYPDEGINLIRAFIAQGARLPGVFFENPTLASIQQFGYGVPSLTRVTTNSEHRISFYSTGNISAEEGHLYSVTIPEELTSPGNEYDILIEVTLAYTGKIRRTRQKTKSYLSTWLDWTTSKKDETLESFRNYALSEIQSTRTDYDANSRNALQGYNWKIKNRRDIGTVVDLNRNSSTLQKDWTTIKSYDLSKQITFAVRGHKGWDKNKQPVDYAIVVSLEILGSNIPIYESIRIANEIEQRV